MKLAVLGATGSIGRQVVAQALAVGDDVTALVREQPKPGEIDDRVAALVRDATDFATVSRLVDGSDAVVSALGHDWTLVRGPLIFTDGPRTGRYAAGPMTPGSGARISRADLADFIVATAADSEFIRMKPLVSESRA
jgi:putative NADH-flavin reductase